MFILGEVLLLIMLIIEYKRYKTIITPFCLIGGVYCICIPVINLICVSFGFYPIENMTILFFVFYLSIFFLCSCFVGLFRSKIKNQKYNIKFLAVAMNKEKIIFFIFLIGLSCYTISLFEVIAKFGINYTKSNSFGLFAHVGMLTRATCPFILLYYYKNCKEN